MERFIAGRKLLDGLRSLGWSARATAPVVLACLLSASCSRNQELAPETLESTPAIATRKAVSSKEHGRKTMCPVTGRIFDVGGESEAAIYKGRVVYFVDFRALEAFLADPSEYDSDPPTMPSIPVRTENK